MEQSKVLSQNNEGCILHTISDFKYFQTIFNVNRMWCIVHVPPNLFNISMNRRTTSNILELVEESLDYNLIGSQIRFHFHDTQIIGGISIHESHGNVIVLVVTAISVHRLVFPHPSKLIKNVSKNSHLI